MRCVTVGLVLAGLWVASVYVLTEDAYKLGLEHGYVKGHDAAAPTEQQVFMQCTQWWFGAGNSRAKQAINQYCDRRKK